MQNVTVPARGRQHQKQQTNTRKKRHRARMREEREAKAAAKLEGKVLQAKARREGRVTEAFTGYNETLKDGTIVTVHPGADPERTLRLLGEEF